MTNEKEIALIAEYLDNFTRLYACEYWNVYFDNEDDQIELERPFVKLGNSLIDIYTVKKECIFSYSINYTKETMWHVNMCNLEKFKALKESYIKEQEPKIILLKIMHKKEIYYMEHIYENW